MGRTPVPVVTVDSPSVPSAPSTPSGPQIYTLSAGIDILTGTAHDDSFDGTLLDSLSVSDTIDGGAGMDTLNLKVSGTAAPAGVAITAIETLNLGTTGAGYTIDASLYAGLEQLNLTATAALAGGETAGAINVKGASTVNITQSTTTTGATFVMPISLRPGSPARCASHRHAAYQDGPTFVTQTAASTTVHSGSASGQHRHAALLSITDRALALEFAHVADVNNLHRRVGKARADLLNAVSGDLRAGFVDELTGIPW